jgi:predicted ATPase
MMSRIHQLVQKRSQFVIATHSPILMAYPNAWLYQITTEGLARIEYQQTEHYIVAKRFLSNTEAELQRLLSD